MNMPEHLVSVRDMVDDPSGNPIELLQPAT